MSLSYPFLTEPHDKSTIALCRAALYETVYSITPEEIDTTSQMSFCAGAPRPIRRMVRLSFS